MNFCVMWTQYNIKYQLNIIRNMNKTYEDQLQMRMKHIKQSATCTNFFYEILQCIIIHN